MAQTTATTTAPQLVALTALHPAPWNPRSIRDVRFQQLCRSLEADPDFLWHRPILADADGEIYAGNMRWRAAEHLGWTEVPAILGPVDAMLARARGLRDNNEYGEWEYEALSGLLADLQAAAVDMETLGFPASELEPLLAATWSPAAIDDAALFDRARDAPGVLRAGGTFRGSGVNGGACRI